MIHIDEIWLATEPLDMLAGPGRTRRWRVSFKCSGQLGLIVRTCSPTNEATG
jgi:hypothetical protein